MAAGGAGPERDRRGELAYRPLSFTQYPVEAGEPGERLRVAVGPVGARVPRTFVFTKVRAGGCGGVGDAWGDG